MLRGPDHLVTSRDGGKALAPAFTPLKTSEVLSLRAEQVSDNSSYIKKEMGESHLEFRISRGPEEPKEIFRTR